MVYAACIMLFLSLLLALPSPLAVPPTWEGKRIFGALPETEIDHGTDADV